MNTIPKHIALIMDGNRRWARGKRLSEMEGHRRGVQRIEPLVDAAMEMGVTHLTFWAFSTENWNREVKEVQFLMNLYRHGLHKKIDSFHKKNVRVHVIGNLRQFPEDIQKKTAGWMEKTKHNTGITVTIALSYGGRDEIMRAINKWNESPSFVESDSTTAGKQKHRSKVKSSSDNLQPATNNLQLTAKNFSQYLDTAGQPDPDLLIRTGGEQRLSGFLLWQLEYAELYFTPTLWPDFTPERLKEAIEEYGRRQRRFGK